MRAPFSRSGTNGYVQRNLSSIRPRDAPRAQPQEKARIFEPDQRILDHERKRKIEIQCIELQDELEEQGHVAQLTQPSGRRN